MVGLVLRGVGLVRGLIMGLFGRGSGLVNGLMKWSRVQKNAKKV